MLDVSAIRARLCLILTILMVALTLPAAGQALVQRTDGGRGAAESVVRDIPNDMTAEQAFRFVGGLTDAEARRLVLDQIHEMRAEEAAARAGPSGLAVVMVHFRMWLEGQAELLRERLL